MKFLVAVLCCLVACALAADNFKDCKSKFARATAVRVNGQDKCEVKKNSEPTFEIDFDMTDDVQGKVDVAALVFNTQQLSIGDPDGCKSGGLTCPLTKGKSYNYQNSVKLGDILVGKIDITWRFLTKKDGKNLRILCVKVPCVISQ